jgi:hypothetical protein
MEKKALPKKEDNNFSAPTSKATGKLSQFSGRLISFLKLFLGLCLLPFVYSVSLSFFNEINFLDDILRNYFWAGLIAFLIIYLFIWEPVAVYRKGQRLLEIGFNFFSPLVKVAPFVLPIYAIIIFLIYLLISLVNNSQDSSLIKWFLFLLSFSISLHLVFSAKSVRSKEEDFLKSNYIFGFSLIYLINLFLVAGILSSIFGQFSFINFSSSSFQKAQDILKAVFNQLF